MTDQHVADPDIEVVDAAKAITELLASRFPDQREARYVALQVAMTVLTGASNGPLVPPPAR